ncbi:hypothetical protein E2320_000146, partial [Naja naja]
MMGFGQYFGALKESHGRFCGPRFVGCSSFKLAVLLQPRTSTPSARLPGRDPYGTAEFSEPPSLGFTHPPAAETQQVPVGVEKPHHGGDEMVFPGELSPPEAEQMMAFTGERE